MILLSLEYCTKVVPYQCDYCCNLGLREKKQVKLNTKRGSKNIFCSKACIQHYKLGPLQVIPKSCPECNTSYSGRNKFCSRKCGTKFNNARRHDDVRKKQSNSIRSNSAFMNYLKTQHTLKTRKKPKPPEKVKKISSREIYLNNPKPCLYCKNAIFYENRNQKTCGEKQCVTKMRSNAGRIAATYITKRSKDEIALFELCAQEWMCFPNYVIKDGWDADIVIVELRIAILWNGPWHYKEMNMTNHSLRQVQTRDKIKMDVLKSDGWNVLVFEDRNYTPYSAFSEIKNFVQRFDEP